MGFEESALARLRRYREEAEAPLDRSVSRATTRRFAERLFAGSSNTSGWAAGRLRDRGPPTAGGAFDLRAVAEHGSEAGVTSWVVPGAAAEADEDLMHEELRRYSLKLRVLRPHHSAVREAPEAPCQTFAYTQTGCGSPRALVAKAPRQGRRSRRHHKRLLPQDSGAPDRPGFPHRRRRQTLDRGAYSLRDLLEGRRAPTELRWPG